MRFHFFRTTFLLLILINPALAETFSTKPYQGSVLYVDFWASWCAPCRASFPFMNQLKAKYAQAGLEIVAVNLDSNRADAERFLKRIPADFKIYFDPEGMVAREFGVKGMPHSFLLNKEGEIIETHIGFRQKDIEWLFLYYC